MRPIALLAALAALPSPALACGGFFCDTSVAPVDQAAERIVFAVDEVTGTVTTHVQIAYEGAAEDFAWVVPVGAVPELFVSNDALFERLANATVPTYQLQNEVSGVCNPPSLRTEFNLSADFDPNGGVDVIAEATVGPYATVVLSASDAGELVAWLEDAGYDLPADIDEVVRPYVASGQYFVALKLASGMDTGDLTPLGMRYAGDAASIPIQLTAIAAVPDMPLTAFVLGSARAVPDNYLHVELNDAAIDWYAGGTNHRAVISRAADEAGGQAFATEFSGSTAAFDGLIWSPGLIDTASLRLSPKSEWIEQVQFSGLPSSSQLQAVIDDATADPGFDADAWTDALDERVLTPLRDAQAMIDAHPRLTRMTSSLDAAEMTADPIFVFNRDLEQDVSNVHAATNEVMCGSYEGMGGGERNLVLEDGRRIRLPSRNWLDRNGMTELEAMAELTSPAALVVTDLSAQGEGEILFDWRDAAAEEARAFDRAGCGCSTPGTAGIPVAALLAGLLVRRRRA